jgi:RNA polymerase sigma factor (TIGR02999 family)
MAHNKSSEVSQILTRMVAGDRSGIDELAPLVYQELRSIARRLLARERPGHTLQPTELVHEAYIKLAQQDRVDWKGRSHFFAVGAHHMRRILVDHARTKLSAKRGRAPYRVELTEDMMLTPSREEDVLAIDEAIEKLRELDRRQAQMVELRFFGGLTVKEVAEVLGVSKRTVEADWAMVRAWLRRELTSSGDMNNS